MSQSEDASWLVIDGYEDEPAAFGVPPYVGFHIRYICGVLEQRGIPYEYRTIDSYRLDAPSLENRLGIVIGWSGSTWEIFARSSYLTKRNS